MNAKEARRELRKALNQYMDDLKNALENLRETLEEVENEYEDLGTGKSERLDEEHEAVTDLCDNLESSIDNVEDIFETEF